MIKKSVLIVAMLLVTINVWAAKTWDVSATVHNMGSTSAFGIYMATNEDEVCIFCHTPHGGTLNTPLWNRTLPNQGAGSEFNHYTSATLSTKIRLDLPTTRPVSAESLLCMSCHDGSVSMGTLVNYSNRTSGNPSNENAYIMPMAMIGVPAADIGASQLNLLDNLAGRRDLSDDHPISFSYFNIKINDSVKGAMLHTVAEAKTAESPTIGVRFFGLDALNGDRVECSSCHDPHVNGNIDPAYAPFLVMSNAGSALCLACHIK